MSQTFQAYAGADGHKTVILSCERGSFFHIVTECAMRVLERPAERASVFGMELVMEAIRLYNQLGHDPSRGLSKHQLRSLYMAVVHCHNHEVQVAQACLSTSGSQSGSINPHDIEDRYEMVRDWPKKMLRPEDYEGVVVQTYPAQREIRLGDTVFSAQPRGFAEDVRTGTVTALPDARYRYLVKPTVEKDRQEQILTVQYDSIWTLTDLGWNVAEGHMVAGRMWPGGRGY